MEEFNVKEENLLSRLKRSGRLIMVTGLFIIFLVAVLNFQNPAFVIWQSVPLLIGIAIYVAGRVLLWFDMREKKR